MSARLFGSCLAASPRLSTTSRNRSSVGEAFATGNLSEAFGDGRFGEPAIIARSDVLSRLLGVIVRLIAGGLGLSGGVGPCTLCIFICMGMY